MNKYYFNKNINQPTNISNVYMFTLITVLLSNRLLGFTKDFQNTVAKFFSSNYYTKIIVLLWYNTILIWAVKI